MGEKMLETLTVKKGLVVEAHGVEPIPGHSLVVFEKTGEAGGLQYYASVEENQRLQKQWLLRKLRRTELFAYAVNNDDDLRHELVRDVTTWDQGGSFKLRCILTFRISNPQEVAQHLESDPLRRIEIKAADLFANTAARVDWVDIEDLGVALERHLLESTSLSGAGVEVSNLKALRTFAFRRGFEIQNVELAVRFSPEFGEVIRRQRKEAQTRAIMQSEARTKQLQVELNAKLAQAETVQESLRSVIASSGENLERIMANISDGVTTPTALKSVVVELVGTVRQISQLVDSPIALETAASYAALQAKVVAALPEPGEISAESARQIQAVSSVVDSLDCTQNEKDGLLSAAFELIGQAVLGSNADPVSLRDAQERFQKAFESVAPKLASQQQHELLTELLSLGAEAEQSFDEIDVEAAVGEEGR